MCTVSMVYDHHYDEWRRRIPWTPSVPYPGTTPPWNPISPHPMIPAPPMPRPLTQDDVDAFRRLVDRAREYDRANNEPACEMEEKRQRLLDLAKELGVDISFI